MDTLMQLPGTGVYSVELGAKPEAVRAARSYVTSVLAAWAIPQDVINMAALLASELATNALTHGTAAGGTFTVEVRSYGCCIGVEVSDGSPAAPVVRAPTSETEHGRGLLLVTEVADSWGYYFGSNHRKHVWFHMRISDPPLPPAGVAVMPAA